MGAPLQGLPLVAAGGKLYRIGGLDARNKPGEEDDLHSVADFYSFDPATKKWTQLPSLPEPRSSHDAVAIGSKIYVIGGWTLDGEGEGNWLETAWVYDTANPNARWEPLPTPPFRRRALAVAEWNGKLVALGGMDDDAVVSERVDLFDPATGEWRQLADFPGGEMAGFGMSAWSLGSCLYASGAEGVLHRLADDGQAWVKVGELQTPRFFHRLLPADSNELFVVAGASMEHGHVGTIEKLHVDVP
jgi:N-acetylneuraminic acid mutarotase